MIDEAVKVGKKHRKMTVHASDSTIYRGNSTETTIRLLFHQVLPGNP
jgi:hypothetical protein